MIVKAFFGDYSDVELELNRFLHEISRNHNVIDIKYGGTEGGHVWSVHALVMYEFIPVTEARAAEPQGEDDRAPAVAIAVNNTLRDPVEVPIRHTAFGRMGPI